jgi:hypothetical protein
MEKTYLIEEAASYVGMNRRTFERLKVSYQEEYREAKDGKKRKVRVYKKSDLDPVKAKREEVYFRPSVDMTTDAKQVVTASDLQDLLKSLVDAFANNSTRLLTEAKSEQKRQSELATFKDKLILNFTQALALSGLPEAELKKAVKDKKILSKKTSEKGQWKIHRESLMEFCQEYFKSETKD